MLYPLKFRPRPKERIWGGRRLSEKLGKRLPRERTIGESWEISGLDGDVSVVGNGILTGNNLEELIEVYMGDLVGDKIYEKFGLQFPLLIKYIDAQDKLSVQVHPDDALAVTVNPKCGTSWTAIREPSFTWDSTGTYRANAMRNTWSAARYPKFFLVRK